MARSFLTPATAAKVTSSYKMTDADKDKLVMGMAIGNLYRSGFTRVQVAAELVNGPAHLTAAEAEEGIARWERNQKFYGKVVTWTGNK